MTRVAAIDCGTNSIRLLVADVDPVAGTLSDVERRMLIVRLGEGVDRTGQIAPAALARTLRATQEYARVCRETGAERIRFVATSAGRDAGNRAEFEAAVTAVLGVAPEVVDGDGEAGLSFAGATRELPAQRGPFLVVDIGGGSTEFVLGARSVQAARSVDMGCVRLTERYLRDDPPGTRQVGAALAEVNRCIDAAAREVPLERTRTLVGVAGTVTTVTAHALGLPRYDPAAIHRAELSAAAVRAACDDLLDLPRQARAALPYMHPGRVDVIGAGALIWRAVVDRVVSATAEGVSSALTSEHDILDGIAWSMA